jgi:hypothetical protein
VIADVGATCETDRWWVVCDIEGWAKIDRAFASEAAAKRAARFLKRWHVQERDPDDQPPTRRCD